MIEERKREHVEICLTEDVQAPAEFWGDVRFVHCSLPEISRAELDLTTDLFGHRLQAPLVISGMTGGFDEAERINANLARAAEALGLAMGVGSQRAALVKPALIPTYAVVRKFHVPLMIANLGIPQFLPQGTAAPLDLPEARAAMQMVGAHVLGVHLNYVQEVAQVEGDENATGGAAALERLAMALPVLAKETGGGVSRETALQLKGAGVLGIDIGGLGGTSFSAVEAYRSRRRGDAQVERIGEAFWAWGIPAPASVVEAQVGLPVIATGGIRSGIDVARALALGARAAGLARPLLAPARESAEAVIRTLEGILQELRSAMFLVGARTPDALQGADIVVTGYTAQWLERRGFNVNGLAQRRQPGASR